MSDDTDGGGRSSALPRILWKLARLAATVALTFLGLCVPPPAPTWGGLLADATLFMESAPWLSVFPGLAITATLLGVNLFGDALRDYLDPRMSPSG